MSSSDSGTGAAADCRCSSARLEAALHGVEILAQDAAQAYAGLPSDGSDFVLPPESSPFVVERWSLVVHEPLTFFHSERIPPISMPKLSEALCCHETRCDDHIAEVALVLMRRYQVTTGLPVTTRMMHRLFVACVLVAAKTHSDHPPSNRRFARASGVSTVELVRLELALLIALRWRSLARASDVDEALDEYENATTVEHWLRSIESAASLPAALQACGSTVTADHAHDTAAASLADDDPLDPDGSSSSRVTLERVDQW